ncbi:MAG TPA: FAD-dependent monooxygenase [Xanthobacteraceae bacterium]|jgi:2-polyprenyl-6-methoxyphenol hydroxylase-like FAD-dependent oxidoreductase|nr:FAD-dependent monooxygenase [Xanthobacteraceae bacterium]
MSKRHQVVIVGGGPVGVALAVELGQRGIDCALVERRREPQRIPKGQNLTQRSVEHFYFWGVAEELRVARLLPPEFPMSGIVAYRDLNSEYWYAPPLREIVNSYYFQNNERLPQYLGESVLRKRMAQLASVEARFGWVANTIEQDASGVRVTIAKDGAAEREVLEAEYVVGCDGGHSTVRQQIGIERGGADFNELMVLALFRSRELHEKLKRFPPRSTYRVIHPDLGGYWQFFGRVDVGESWFFHSPVPANTTRDNYDFHGLLQKVAGFPFACDFDYVGFWDLRIAVAEKYQVGRVFIAGDAAHSHPPYGAYGLNNGLDDVVNLGWKIAAKLKGWGSDALLGTYTEERRPIFKETAEDFIEAGIQRDKEFLDHHNPQRDRAEFEHAWKEHANAAAPRVLTYEPNYEGSPIVFGPPGGVSSAHGSHTFTARAGHHLPPQLLSSGRNVFEELGPDFTLLAFDADDRTVQAFIDAAKALNVPLKVVRDSYRDGRKAYEASLILVRPDRYIAWSAVSAPADAAAVLGKAVGQA